MKALKEVKSHVVNAVKQKQSESEESWWETARKVGGRAMGEEEEKKRG